MALKKETIKTIATKLKIKEEDLSAALTNTEEVDLEVDDSLTVLTEAEAKTLKANEYTNGKKAGIEIAVKDTKEKLDLDFTGKTVDGLLEAYKKKVLDEAKINPDKKVTELEGKITTLQNTVKEYETKLSERDTEVTGIRINGELYKHVPAAGEDGPAYEADDVIGLMKMKGYDFKLEGDKIVPYKDGKAMTDKLSNNRDPKEVIQEFMTEKKLLPGAGVPAGRGGKDQKAGNNAGKLSDLKKQFEAQGKNVQGQEFAEAVKAAVAANKDFDLKS
jgi:ribosomal protein S13